MNFSPEQKSEIDKAQRGFAKLKSDFENLNATQLDALFREGRSQNGWQDRSVSDDQLKSIFDLTRMGATSMNCCPARFVFIRSEKQKEKLKAAMAPPNVDKMMTAPVVTIIGHDTNFHEHLPRLFPKPVKPMFDSNDALRESTAFRNGTLQGAYFMLAARSLGMDCGPMSGFDNAVVDELFFAGTPVKSNFLCGLGYGDPEKLFMRLPRLDFDEVCKIL